MRFLICKLISIYQIWFSFDRGILMTLAPTGACRFEVSCSEYTKQQVISYGVVKGLFKGIRRIFSCR